MGLVAHNKRSYMAFHLFQKSMTLSKSQGTAKVNQVLLGCSALFSLDSEGTQSN